MTGMSQNEHVEVESQLRRPSQDPKLVLEVTDMSIASTATVLTGIQPYAQIQTQLIVHISHVHCFEHQLYPNETRKKGIIHIKIKGLGRKQSQARAGRIRCA